MNVAQWNRWLSSIQCWILLFFIVHLYGIWQPPIEAAHSWRQATGLMVARNYFEGNTTFLYPMVDETNGGTGIIGMEFPILYYIQGKLGLLFGFHDGIGRLINVVISTIGVAYFYALIRRFSSEKMAFYAAILFMISSYFMYSRKVMPDTAAIALYVIGIYYFFNALNHAKWKDICLSFAFLSLGLLVKIAVLPLLGFLVFAYLFYRNRPKISWVFMLPILSLIPALLWYFVWNPYLSTTYGNWYNIGGSLTEGSFALVNSPIKLIEQLFFHPFFSYLVWGGIVFGFYQALKQGLSKEISFSLVTFIALFVGYALKSGQIFITHEYYILPLVPVLAIAGGYGFAKWGKYAWVFIVLTAIEAVANQVHDFRYNRNEAYKLRLRSIGVTYIPQDALVSINGNSNPQELYFLKRRGWNLSDESMCNGKKRKSLMEQGCSYWLFNKHSMKCSAPKGQVLYNRKEYLLVKCRK